MHISSIRVNPFELFGNFVKSPKTGVKASIETVIKSKLPTSLTVKILLLTDLIKLKLPFSIDYKVSEIF